MMLGSTNATATTRTVNEQIEMLSRFWANYYCDLPHEKKFWPGLVRMDWVSERLLRAGMAILINVLPAAIPLQILLYFKSVSWTVLVLDALLVLEIGPCRILTRLVDRVAPYPEEGVPEILPET